MHWNTFQHKNLQLFSKFACILRLCASYWSVSRLQWSGSHYIFMLGNGEEACQSISFVNTSIRAPWKPMVTMRVTRLQCRYNGKTSTAGYFNNVIVFTHWDGERKAKLRNPQISYNELKGQKQLGKSMKLIFKTRGNLYWKAQSNSVSGAW